MVSSRRARRRRRADDFSIALCVGAVTALVLGGCSVAQIPRQDPQQVADVISTTTVTYQGQAQQVVLVPAGATGVLIDAIGGGGGAGTDDKGSLGAEVRTQQAWPVKAGEGLAISIGGRGQNGSNEIPGAGGWGGNGGNGGTGGTNPMVDGGAGAGGATTVQFSTGTTTALQLLVVAGGGGGGGSEREDSVQTDVPDDVTGAADFAGGDAGTNPEAGGTSPDFAIWQGSRGHGPAGGLAGVDTDGPNGGLGGLGVDGGGSGGGGGGGFQGGYGGNGASGDDHDGSGGGAGSTAVAVPISSGVIVAPAPGNFRAQNGQVVLTWLTS
jgi:hypothetical protein